MSLALPIPQKRKDDILFRRSVAQALRLSSHLNRGVTDLLLNKAGIDSRSYKEICVLVHSMYRQAEDPSSRSKMLISLRSLFWLLRLIPLWVPNAHCSVRIGTRKDSRNFQSNRGCKWKTYSSCFDFVGKLGGVATYFEQSAHKAINVSGVSTTANVAV
jgi:hypothetical protein